MNNNAQKKFSLPKIEGNTSRLLVILLAFLAIATVTKGSAFANVGNMQSLGKQLTEYGLMAIGVGICMISGGIDLSTVYIANLAGISAGLLMKSTVLTNVPTEIGIIISILVALAVGLICGAFNGVLISYLHIPPMLATLGSYQLFMGISVVISKGSTVSGIPAEFTKFASTIVFGIPLPFIIFVLVAIVMSFIMYKTRFGNKVYLVGTNEKTALFTGIKTKLVIIQTYMISGLISAIAGLISLSRINSAKADFGSSYTMQCILIVVLGGVNPNGGFGSIPGIAIAVVVLQILSSYLNMFPTVSNYYRDLIWGIALIAVLIINTKAGKKKEAK